MVGVKWPEQTPQLTLAKVAGLVIGVLVILATTVAFLLLRDFALATGFLTAIFLGAS